MLVGMAIADGKIERVNQPVTDWLYELYEHGFGDVTVADLLSMSSGSDYDETVTPSRNTSSSITPLNLSTASCGSGCRTHQARFSAINQAIMPCWR